MYSETKDVLLDGLLYAAFKNNWDEIDDAPSDDELAKMYPVPEGGAKKYVKLYKKSVRKKKRTPWTVVKRAAVIFLAIVSAVFAILMTNDDVRAAVFESIAKWFDGHIEIDYNEAQTPSDNEKESIYDFEIGYIPEDYELFEKHEWDTIRSFRYWRNNDEDRVIIIKIATSAGTSINLDRDHSEYEHTMINGMDTYIIYDHNENMGSVVMGNKEFTIRVAGDVDYDELLKIAENIK